MATDYRRRPATVGLGVFLAVAGTLFALLMSAYVVRMQLLDWRPLPVPRLLWFNTGVLVLSSVILQWAQAAARRGDYDGTVTGVLCAGVSAIVFLIGQLLAWRQLITAGYVVAANPANSFFYLVTAIHGLHLLGGLVALGRTIAKLWSGRRLAEIAPERGIVRPVLALPAPGLADASGASDRLDTRLP